MGLLGSKPLILNPALNYSFASGRHATLERLLESPVS
jgi:hypothetical protein